MSERRRGRILDFFLAALLGWSLSLLTCASPLPLHILSV